MNNGNFDEKSADALFDVVAKKLGMPKEQLKSEFAQGNFNSALKNMNSEESAKLNAAMSNPALVQKLVSSPQMKALYEKFSEKK
ncbi:MAG: hypothetical protein IJO29_08205 [Oscillospiraceae bacterium]|nr:hypothetical protein [Oscillospiraceae bacterium]